MTSVLTRPLGNPFKRAASAPAEAPEMVATGPVFLHEVPRANLLPPSVLAAQKARRSVRGVVLLAAVAVAMALLGTAGAWLNMSLSESDLADARAEGDSLIAQQAEFSDVSVAEASIAQLEAARADVGAMDVDWSAYLGAVRGTLPEGMSLQGVAVEAATPVSVVTAPTGALVGARVASLQLTVTSDTFEHLEGWMDTVPNLPGYVDATLSSVTEGTGGYQAIVTLGLNQDIYSGLYTQEVAQ